MQIFKEIMNHTYKIVLAFVVLTFTLVVSYKLVTGSIAFDMSKFSFNDLLSLVLALFSIALSLIFYHKATETSNTFYDNTYRFTSHVSEVLGRIEAGFSEKLRHIDEGYTRLGDRFERMSAPQKKEAEEAIANEEKAIESAQHEREKLISELTLRAQLRDSEKDDFLDRLHKQDAELMAARAELSALRQRLVKDQDEVVRERISRRSEMSRLRSYVREVVIPKIGKDLIRTAPFSEVVGKFREVRDQFNARFIFDISHLGLVDKELDLTIEGARFLRETTDL
jgi:hypothetical protein